MLMLFSTSSDMGVIFREDADNARSDLVVYGGLVIFINESRCLWLITR